MERLTAQALIAEYLKYEEILHRVTELSHAIDDVETQNSIRRAASDAQCYLYQGLVEPLVKLFPDLALHNHQVVGGGSDFAGVRAPRLSRICLRRCARALSRAMIAG
jgi:hypothetical protein